LERLSQNQQNKIADALDTAQVYLLNQSGFSESKSFQLGNAIIAWNGNESPFRDYSDGIVQITFLESDILASLSSNFDSSQTFFEVLEQRDKIEKGNQELKNKETLLIYGISPNTLTKSDSTSDSIMQTLLKESKEGRI